MSIATLETYTVDVCEDCYFAFHTGVSYPLTEPLPLSLLWDVTILGGCTQHAECEDHGFGWSACDGCGSVLGGMRYPLAYVVEGGE